jgi:methionyl-tRNA formyltransferase
MGRLAASGAALMADTLNGIESGEIRAEPQPSEGISFAPKITPEDARVDWGQPATAIDRQIRAFTPEPGAWTEYGGVRLKLGPVEPKAPAEMVAPGGALAPGELLITRYAVFAGTGTEPVRLGDVQPPGKRPMPAADWARGLHAAGGGDRPKLG